MAKPKQYWLVKQEPTAYSWERFVKDGKTSWTGVRNYQARNNLQGMALGDQVFFYHSVVGKEVVGIAKVVQTAYPDPTADEPAWVCVDLAPVKPLPKPVTLEQIKAEPGLKNIGLVRNSRISVIPLSEEEFRTVCQMGGMR
jgi:predicted RNA-binding protein with PUA-like domain